jgi:hypothetical protein
VLTAGVLREVLMRSSSSVVTLSARARAISKPAGGCSV